MFLFTIFRIPVRLNMSLPKIKCDFVGIDIQDDMGRHEVGFVENTVKTPIGIDEEGCLFEARFHVNKVRNVPGYVDLFIFWPITIKLEC